MSELGDGVAAGGKTIGMGLIVLTGYRLFVFLCTFFAGRLDARHAQLTDQQARLDASIGKRLHHLEETEKANQARIAVLEEEVADYREVTVVLAAEVRILNPTSQALTQMEKILARTFNPTVDRHVPADMAAQLGKMK